MKIIKEDDRGKTYQADGFKILYRNKDTISGDNSENAEEIIYLVSGSAEVTLGEKTWVAHFPSEIFFPAKTYHKIRALTDIVLILFEK